MKSKFRLDKVAANFFKISRKRAKNLIQTGEILVNSERQKPAFCVGTEDHIEILTQKFFISRAGEKLHNFLQILKNEKILLENFFENARILDVGSSTGGFAGVLLELGARVVCVDVGKNQLHESLKNHPKISSHEGIDIRNFAPENTHFSLLVCDVSFISIEKIFPTLQKFSNEMILLFKPNFEIFGAKKNKKGVLIDENLVEKSVQNFVKTVQNLGFTVKKSVKATPSGKEGNVEFFFYLSRIC